MEFGWLDVVLMMKVFFLELEFCECGISILFGRCCLLQEYMETMQEEEPEKYQAHFAKYVDAGIEPEEIEDLFTEVRGCQAAVGLCSVK